MKIILFILFLMYVNSSDAQQKVLIDSVGNHGYILSDSTLFGREIDSSVYHIASDMQRLGWSHATTEDIFCIYKATYSKRLLRSPTLNALQYYSATIVDNHRDLVTVAKWPATASFVFDPMKFHRLLFIKKY